MKDISKYKVSNTNGQKGNLNFVRVYEDDKLIAEVSPPKRNPLAYIQKYNGKYRKDLVQQLMEHGLEPDQIKDLLTL